ncbi:hypothetical protein IEO21_08845 [Rhodonia placenta]|uniref:FAD-binding domain-containing protein n=1 Tax=Rhodonia placenta TaxID=104341 RepID=A0A8H7NVP9_9APHY|nr:hypothetical protein IEO21_08845 [Postia placenta]
MESKTKVIIAGAGIAGPVLAIFLKLKGYEPVVYERTLSVPDAGLSLCLQPNGLRVLSLIPGFVEKLSGKQISKVVHCSLLPEEETVLVESGLVSKLPETVGFGLFGIRRPKFHHQIIEEAEAHDIRIIWGHQAVGFEQSEDHVKVTFVNGDTDTASFVVGCDGLHSNTRISLFGKEPVSFTGLTQTGGVSPAPDALRDYGMRNFYADGAHMILYPVNDSEISWAITQREPETKETWGHMDDEAQRAFKEGPWSHWSFCAGELVRTSDRIVKFGLYDRPELSVWHKGRVVLLGDAAHPTSPHLGQGANQAFEDVYHFVRLLKKHNPSASAPSTELLSTIFTEYESLRMARTSALVKGARKQGEARVVEGVEACKARNNSIREAWRDGDAIAAGYMEMYSHPFLEKSDI